MQVSQSIPSWMKGYLNGAEHYDGELRIMADEHRWRDINFPFPMSFPMRMLTYVVLDLTIINLIVLYLAEHLSLGLVLAVDIVEIAALAVAIAFWVSPYKLKW